MTDPSSTDALTAQVERLLAAVHATYTDEGALIYLADLADKAEALAGGPADKEPKR